MGRVPAPRRPTLAQGVLGALVPLGPSPAPFAGLRPDAPRPTSRQRNGYCKCGSGKKGKDCCYGTPPPKQGEG